MVINLWVMRKLRTNVAACRLFTKLHHCENLFPKTHQEIQWLIYKTGLHKCRCGMRARPSVPNVSTADPEENAFTLAWALRPSKRQKFNWILLTNGFGRIFNESGQNRFHINTCTHQDSLCFRCQPNIMPVLAMCNSLPRIRLFSISMHCQKPPLPFISSVLPGSCCRSSSFSMLTHSSACCSTGSSTWFSHGTQDSRSKLRSRAWRNQPRQQGSVYGALSREVKDCVSFGLSICYSTSSVMYHNKLFGL